MVKILVDGKEYNEEHDIRVMNFLNSHGITSESPIMGVLVNGEQKSLRHKIANRKRL